MPEFSPFSLWDVVVVTYNSEDDLSRWWRVPQDLRDRVIVVDNGSTDGSIQLAQQLFGRVIATTNNGLSVANNMGAAAGSAPFVLFCNPDVTPAGGFEELESHLRATPGVVSPRLQYLDGTPQDNARGWPTLVRQTMNRLVKQERNDYRWPVESEASAPVPWVLGAAVATTREAFEAVGGWPEEYFLYFEDTELCLRYWEKGYGVFVRGDITWTHAWARSSRRLLSTSGRLHLASAVRFYGTHLRHLFVAPPRLQSRLLSLLAPSPTPVPVPVEAFAVESSRTLAA